MPAAADSSTNRGGPRAATGPLDQVRVTAKTRIAISAIATPAASRATLATPRFPIRLTRVVTDVVSLRLFPGGPADRLTHSSPGEIVGGDVDSTVQAGEAGLVGGGVIGGPLQCEVRFPADLVLEGTGVDGPLAEPAGKELATGDGGKDFGRGATERAVPRHVAGEGRRHEGGPLIRDPIGGQYPVDATGLGLRVGRISGPGADGDLILVASQGCVPLARRGGLLGDHFDEAGDES